VSMLVEHSVPDQLCPIHHTSIHTVMFYAELSIYEIFLDQYTVH